MPLAIEEKDENHYVLVDGYLRYYALQFLGIEIADCMVEEMEEEMFEEPASNCQAGRLFFEINAL